MPCLGVGRSKWVVRDHGCVSGFVFREVSSGGRHALEGDVSFLFCVNHGTCDDGSDGLTGAQPDY